MALKSTIFKVQLSIADMDRSYYEPHSLTIARHPSETDERMMVRLLAFALHASQRLEFTKGLCVDEEPDLWQKNFSNDIEVWIDVGQPSEKRIRQACHKSDQVVIYAYGGRTVQPWWDKVKGPLSRFKNLQVFDLSAEVTKALSQMAVQRGLDVNVTVQDGEVMMTCDAACETFTPTRLV